MFLRNLQLPKKNQNIFLKKCTVFQEKYYLCSVRNEQLKHRVMRTLKEIFEESNKEQKTLSEIVGLTLVDTEGFGFVEQPFCILISKVETKNSYIVYFKYECTDRLNINSLCCGYYKATIEKDGSIYDVEAKKENNLISE